MLTVPEAARRVDRNPETIRRWIRAGRLRSQKVGTQHLVDERELDLLVAGGEDTVDELAAGPTWTGEPQVDWACVVRRSRSGRQALLVLDASAALGAASAAAGFDRYAGEQLVAPPLMWSEARSSLHEALWRREVGDEQAARTFDVLHSGAIEMRHHDELPSESWRLADELGWAKTYDAEYVALALLLGCRLVTLDGRLRRGADRLGVVVHPSEL